MFHVGAKVSLARVVELAGRTDGRRRRRGVAARCLEPRPRKWGERPAFPLVAAITQNYLSWAEEVVLERLAGSEWEGIVGCSVLVLPRDRPREDHAPVYVNDDLGVQSVHFLAVDVVEAVFTPVGAAKHTAVQRANDLTRI